jgi:putative endonuclease
VRARDLIHGELRKAHDLTAFVYILRCSDGSYYVGSARADLDRRIGEHQGGEIPGYTSTRRPVELVFAEEFQRITDAIAAERQIKGWSRAKKEALIRGDWPLVRWLAKRPGARARGGASFEARPSGLAPQDEEG